MLLSTIITKIEAVRRDEDWHGVPNMSLNYDVNVRTASVVKAKDATLLRVDYRITVNYLHPSLGFIAFDGYCDFNVPDAEKTTREWNTNSGDEQIKSDVANAAISRIFTVGMVIAESLLLPPIAPIPHIAFNKPGQQPESPNSEKYDVYHA